MSPGTQRRLAEIERRQANRAAAGLPGGALSPAVELRRMWRLEREAAFQRWAEPRKPAVVAEIMGRWRAAIGNPAWHPNLITGMAIGAEARQILMEAYKSDRPAL